MSEIQKYTVAELFEKWYHQQETPAERELLMELLKDDVHAAELKLVAEKMWEVRDKNEPYFEQKTGEEILDKILKKEKKYIPSVVTYRTLFKWRLKYAASILAVILTGVVVYFFVAKSGNPEAAATVTGAGKTPALALINDVPPGKEGAFLTLDDGTTILLDDKADGALVTGEAAIVTKINGTLMYSSGSVTAQMAYNTMSTPRGRQFKLQLPDGTVVWLNAASSIRYPVAFGPNERKVELTGEAYFEVAKDPTKSFIVMVGQNRVDVLGTSFNVNAYADEVAMQTTLLEGSVKLSSYKNAHPVKEAYLNPGQQAQINSSNHQITIREKANIEEVVAWKNGLIMFENADLPSVMRMVARWYDVDVVYQGIPPIRTFTGEIPKETNVSELLKILTLSDIKFRVENKTITVLP